jgi:hypothetical protein
VDREFDLRVWPVVDTVMNLRFAWTAVRFLTSLTDFRHVSLLSFGAEAMKFIKFHRLRWYGHGERMLNQGMPELIATVTMEGTRKRGRIRKRGC